MPNEFDFEEIKVADKEAEAADKDATADDATKTINVKPGDAVSITLTAEEESLIKEVKDIKAGNFKVQETEDVLDVIDNTLALQVPAVDGAVVTVEIPADAEAEDLDDITLSLDDDVIADIVTLVNDEE